MRNKYMEHRTNLNITDKNVEQLIEIRNEFGLRSYDKVIEFLLELKKSAKIEKKYKCETCGETLEISPGTDPKKIGLLHSHITKTDCTGCIGITHVLKGTTTASDNSSGQTDETEHPIKMSEIPQGTVTKTEMTPRGRVFTIDGIDYLIDNE